MEGGKEETGERAVKGVGVPDWDDGREQDEESEHVDIPQSSEAIESNEDK